MRPHLLGCHWIRIHPDSNDLPHIGRMQYRSLKLFEWSWSDADFCRDLLSVLPQDAAILARDHPLSEQKDDLWRDPIGTGIRHAEEWADKVRGGRYHLPIERTYFLGINEPDATSGDRTAIDRYTVAFLTRLQAHGLHGGAFNFSTGHPRTQDGTGSTPADYSVFENSHQAIVAGRHIAVCHIYGTSAQPCLPGHYDRLQACPWEDVQWVIGEGGIDDWLAGGGQHIGYQGPYQGRLDEYAGWLDRFLCGLLALSPLPPIHSFMPFTYDFSKPWDSFDVRPIRAALENYPWQHDRPSPAPPSHEVFVPVVSTPPALSPGDDDPAALAARRGGGGKTDANWQRCIEFVMGWEGGYVNDPQDLGGETNFGISKRSYPDLDIKHLTREQAIAIYRRDYWQASGASELPWPLSLLVFDSAVLHGVGTARQWLAEVGPNPYAFAAKRLDTYTRLAAWPHFGAGWTRRTADLLKEMGESA